MILTPDAEGTGVRASVARSSDLLDRSRHEKFAEGPDDLDGPGHDMRQNSAIVEDRSQTIKSPVT
jgi:hypothetical protein